MISWIIAAIVSAILNALALLGFTPVEGTAGVIGEARSWIHVPSGQVYECHNLPEGPDTELLRAYCTGELRIP